MTKLLLLITGFIAAAIMASLAFGASPHGGSAYTVVKLSASLASGNVTNTGTVSCAAGKTAVGGGVESVFGVNASPYLAAVIASKPVSNSDGTSGWLTTVARINTADTTLATVTRYAVCG